MVLFAILNLFHHSENLCFGRDAREDMGMLKTISEILKEAGQLGLNMQVPGIERISKGGLDFATEADLRVQELLINQLQDKFPGMPILGEEDKVHQMNLSETFIIDPIDGTFDYSYGGEEWGVMLSYFKDGEVTASAIFQPRLNNLLVSSLDQGSFLNGKKISLREIPSSLEESVMIQCLGNWISKTYPEEVLLPLVSRVRICRSFGSAAQVAIQLAKGNGHCFVGESGKVWDYAPISLLVKTLGGCESDFNGDALDWIPDVMQVVFSFSDNLHSQVLQVIRNP